jgi:lipopolysaccharide biosynthesis protein
MMDDEAQIRVLEGAALGLSSEDPYNYLPRGVSAGHALWAAKRIRALIDEKARLRAALELLRDLPIIENDGPDTLHIKGHAYTGPVVDYFFHTIRKIKEVARAVLSPNPDRQED